MAKIMPENACGFMAPGPAQNANHQIILWTSAPLVHVETISKEPGEHREAPLMHPLSRRCVTACQRQAPVITSLQYSNIGDINVQDNFRLRM